MDDEAKLIAAVLQIRLTDPTCTTKQVHERLVTDAQWAHVTAAEAKKMCSKAAKQTAQKTPPSTTPAALTKLKPQKGKHRSTEPAQSVNNHPRPFYEQYFDDAQARGDEERKAADEAATPHLRQHSRATVHGLPEETKLNGAVVRIDTWDEASQSHRVYLCQLPSGAVSPIGTELHLGLCNLDPEPEEARDDGIVYREAVAAADTILDLLRTCDGTDEKLINKIELQKNVLCNFGELTMAKGLARLISHLALLVECGCEYTCLAPAFEQGHAQVTDRQLDGCVVFTVRGPSADGLEAIEEYERQHRRWFYRSFGAITAIDAMIHHVRVRKKVAHSPLLPMLAEWIRNPACHWTTLELPLYLAGSVLQFPTTRHAEYHLERVVRPFFELCSGVRERIASIAKANPMLGPRPVEYAERLDMWRQVARLPEGELFMCNKMIALWDQDAYALHDRLQQEEACSAANCMNIAMHSVNGESETFQVCARCRCARYCSRECQRWDWKYGGHKHECEPVKKL